jgi:DNA repair protein Rad10
MRASTNPFGRTIQEIASSVAERSKPRPTTPAPFPGQLSATVNVAGFVKASSFKQLGMPPPQSPVAAKQAFPPAPLPKSARSGPSKGPTTTLQVSERQVFCAFVDYIAHLQLTISFCKQRKNPVTDHIKAVKKEFSTHIIPDFIMTSNSCAFFLSIQYHKLHPEYIKTRIKETPSRYAVRVLLVYVDTDDNSTALNDLNKFAIFNNMTLILAWR